VHVCLCLHPFTHSARDSASRLGRRFLRVVYSFEQHRDRRQMPRYTGRDRPSEQGEGGRIESVKRLPLLDSIRLSSFAHETRFKRVRSKSSSQFTAPERMNESAFTQTRQVDPRCRRSKCVWPLEAVIRVALFVRARCRERERES
jgi:hypothetical protein